MGRTRVEDEGGRTVCETDGETGADAVRDTSEGGGEEDEGVDTSGADCGG